jgi:hypothetical protein
MHTQRSIRQKKRVNEGRKRALTLTLLIISLLLRQTAQYVFQLVIATPLYRRLRPEHGVDGGPQGLGPSDDEEPLLPQEKPNGHGGTVG